MTGVALQVVTQWTETAVRNIVGFGLFAGLIATGVSFGYRGATRRAIPVGTAVLIGVGAVAAWLNYTAVTGGAVIAETDLLRYTTSYYLLGVFLASVGTATAGHWIGEYLARDVFGVAQLPATPGGERIRSAGESVELTLPEPITDLPGYSPATEQAKRQLAGERMLLPRSLATPALQRRLEERIEADYPVDHATVAVEDDTVSRVAVGAEPSGLGPSVPPREVAVAIEVDAVADASAGDPVEIWTTADESELITRARLRSTVGETATVVVDEERVDQLDVGERYRLSTRPAQPSDRDQFVAALRTAPETITSITAEPGGPFEGEFVSWIPATTLLLVRDGNPRPFPADNETIRAGDTVYVLGTPDAFDELEAYEQSRRNGDVLSSAD